MFSLTLALSRREREPRTPRPCDGTRALNRATGQDWRYAGGWHMATSIALPAGGATVDAEARAAIGAILEALKAAAILAPD